MRRVKIFLVTVLGILIPLVLVACVMTDAEVKSQKIKMQNPYAITYLMKQLKPFSNGYIYSDWVLCANINHIYRYIYTANIMLSESGHYSSVLLLDSSLDIINEPSTVILPIKILDTLIHLDYDIQLQLDEYCSDEQLNHILTLFHNGENEPKKIEVELYGFIDKWKLIPQMISFRDDSVSDTMLTLEFDNSPTNGMISKHIEWQQTELWVQSLYPNNNDNTEECQKMALRELEILVSDNRISYSSNENNGVVRFEGSYAYEVNFYGETFYLLIGTRGFPLRIAISNLMPIYIFLIVLALFLSLLVTYIFGKTLKRQMALENAKQNLLNAAAHDFKTPLSIIRNYCEGLLEKINEDEKERYYDIIQDETTRIKESASKLLELSQLSPEVGIKFRRHYLSEIVRSVFAQYRKSFKQKNIDVELSLLDNILISCESLGIEKVLSNFVSNAIRHTNNNGMIKIKTSNEDTYSVTFSIENSGSHIPSDSIKHIWDAYYKADNTRFNSERTGIGLSIAKRILIAHGFQYGVENTELGIRFWFST